MAAILQGLSWTTRHSRLSWTNCIGATLDAVRAMNGPQRDLALLDEAGVALEQALFPLLVLVDRLGPIGTVSLTAQGATTPPSAGSSTGWHGSA